MRELEVFLAGTLNPYNATKKEMTTSTIRAVAIQIFLFFCVIDYLNLVKIKEITISPIIVAANTLTPTETAEMKLKERLFIFIIIEFDC